MVPAHESLDNAALAELVAGLDNRWAAASIGSMGASGLELKTGASIMAIGGFTGSRQLADSARSSKATSPIDEVRYFIDGEHFGPVRQARVCAASEITPW